MKRTVTALYETRAQAEQVQAALVAAHLGADVDIRDESDTAGDGKSEHRGFGAWLNHLLGDHHDRPVYIEGVRRGHFMLSAKVTELQETRAAEILDAETPLDLDNAQTIWRAEGWAPVDASSAPISTTAPGKNLNDKAAASQPATSTPPASAPTASWVGVRVYSFDENLLNR